MENVTPPLSLPPPLLLSPFILATCSQPIILLDNQIRYNFIDDRPTRGQNPHAIKLNELIRHFLSIYRLPYSTNSGTIFTVDSDLISMIINIYHNPRDLKQYVIEFQCIYEHGISNIDNIFKKFEKFIKFHEQHQNNYDGVLQSLIDQLNLEHLAIQQNSTVGGLEFGATTFEAMLSGVVLPVQLNLNSYDLIINVLQELQMLMPTISNVIDCLIKYITEITKHNRFAIYYMLDILLRIMDSNKNEFISYLQENNLIEELKHNFRTLLQNIDDFESSLHYGGISNPIQYNSLYSSHKNMITCMYNNI
jgi:hypothetical protein